MSSSQPLLRQLSASWSMLASLEQGGLSHDLSPRSEREREDLRGPELSSWYGGGCSSLTEESFLILWMLATAMATGTQK